MKEWQAFNDLKKKIDDFNETCPLLELMANRSMKDRHWDRIAQLTGHTFDVHLDSFQLRNIMEAPLLPHKDDIEDICVSAVKEKDIEAKLKQVGGLLNEFIPVLSHAPPTRSSLSFFFFFHFLLHICVLRKRLG